MDALFDVEALLGTAQKIWLWAQVNVFTLAAAFQLALVAFLGLASLWAAPRLRRLGAVLAEHGQGPLRALGPTVAPTLRDIAVPLTWFLLLLVADTAALRLETSSRILSIAVSLTGAWVVIRTASGLIREPFWSRTVAVVAWTVAALDILGLLPIIIAGLDTLAIRLGDFRLSALLVVQAAITLGLLLWGAMVLSAFAQRRIRTMTHLTLSARALFSNMLHITLLVAAIVIALTAVGVDLTMLAVFGGAIGLGLGFGLQKIVSNLISGIILLMDRSVKPGDVIAVAGTYGRINAIGARYVSVITRDGIEHLIPNEELITTRVENWSFSDTNVRVRIPIGVSYDTDLRQAMALCLEAARTTPRILANPEPKCLLTGFGDSSVDLELRVWILDPEDGVGSIQSAVLLSVWDAFQANNITIPFPQRTLHFATPQDAARAAQPVVED